MKRIFALLLAVTISPCVLHAGDDEINVISYYAVGNSLDGQPLIDRVNVLRFYPVFAMRTATDSVVVTIYYGPGIFTRAAVGMDDGRYWQTLLPKFKLGEAIQRLEVEVLLDLRQLHFEDDQLQTELQNAKAQIAEQRKKLKSKEVKRIAQEFDDPKAFDFRQQVRGMPAPDSQAVVALVEALTKLQELYRSALYKVLIDTSYSGPGVKKSDLIIQTSDLENPKAKILYRNYKRTLRQMPALDPAERLGVFRIRYVPFPVVGTKSRPRMSLVRPLGENSSAVFEVGLAFGDVIVPGDDFVLPEFSFRRLGFAFAITEKFFSAEAEIIGLALTYDFNSYGSLGLGGNFAQGKVHGYASLGINKKAFEAVLTSLADFFR